MFSLYVLYTKHLVINNNFDKETISINLQYVSIVNIFDFKSYLSIYVYLEARRLSFFFVPTQGRHHEAFFALNKTMLGFAERRCAGFKGGARFAWYIY